ncbi:MAG TPA: ABC transporter ATP-binding protein [Phycisphaerae bacterium]|nr:ABC transporter ATP-binding protein [Phycisphaerae bacterium]
MTAPAIHPAPVANVSGCPTHVRLENVHKSFDKLVVLDGVTLNIPERESVVVIGPSGTGKSVLLKHIIGLLRPDKGEVYFRDRRIDGLGERELQPIRKRFGFLFQQSALFDSLTVFENVAFPLREHTTCSESAIRDRVAQKLAMVGLDGTQNKMPVELSGGMRKRVALARAIALDPEVVLYDEPTTGLDPIRADVINELILKLNDELHVTSVVVTHDMASAFKVADRMIMLSNGKVIAEGKPDDFRHSQNEEVERFVQGKATPEELAALHRKPR